MYRELILDLTKENKWVKIQPPCPDDEIKRAEQIVGYPFPEELRRLLREMNGDQYCLLSAEEIIKNVKLNREIWLPLFEEDYSKELYITLVDRFIFLQQTAVEIIIATVSMKMGFQMNPPFIFGNTNLLVKNAGKKLLKT